MRAGLGTFGEQKDLEMASSSLKERKRITGNAVVGCWCRAVKLAPSTA